MTTSPAHCLAIVFYHHIIQVTGVDENPPVWGTFSPAYTDATTPYNVAENTATGITIVTAATTDADDGSDGVITYSIQKVVDG